MSDLCPCGSSQKYSECCQPYHLQSVRAPVPEALMRSRYSAFCKAEIDYLVLTSNPDQGTESVRETLRETCENTQWLALKIIDTAAGADEDEGFVEFVAFFKGKNQSLTGQLHERSRFKRVDGAWIYWDGQILPSISYGRNDDCWCGSGRKLKKCHAN